jgi:hypothetical protein
MKHLLEEKGFLNVAIHKDTFGVDRIAVAFN